MDNYICVTCGVQYGDREGPPETCPICEDERQWVRHEGQAWTTLAKLQRSHKNEINPLEPGLTEIVTEPRFAIGQRALLVRTPAGNILWDCVSLIDDETIEAVEQLGGISALALSHPHMYASMVAWSHAFGRAPIHLHAANERWVMWQDPVVAYWKGDSLPLDQGVSLHRCGGHFAGSAVLHWPQGAEGRGVLLSSDTLHVTPDRKHVTVMYSYPNYIPLSATVVEEVADRIEPLEFDRMYSHFPGLVLETDAKRAVHQSVERYKQAIGG